MNYSVVLALAALIAIVNGKAITIFGTGLTNSNTQAAGGSADLHWTLVSSPTSSTPQPATVANSAAPYAYPNHGTTSNWIGQSADLTNSFAVGNFVYQTTFDLTGMIPSTATLSGIYSVDDSSSILLNGVTVDAGCPGNCWNSGTGFAINSGFISGVNTLTFLTFNTGGPAGLQVAVQGTAQPATPQNFCTSIANPSDWTPYGQGYYCWNNNAGFIQCWGSSPYIFSEYQACASGTTCRCSGTQECSNHGTESPCI